MNINENHINKIIKLIEKNDLYQLKKYIKFNNIDLKDINNDEFDILIFSIEKYAPIPIINFIIKNFDFKSLNYSFYSKNGYEKYNTDSFSQNFNFAGYKIPLFSAIACKNFEAANLLIKNKADINYNAFLKNNENFVDMLTFLFYCITPNYNICLDSENFRYILNNGYYIKGITNDIVNKLIFLIQNYKNDIIKMIFKHYIFDNNFILNLILKYKNKTVISKKQFKDLITSEKNKLVIEEILYQTAIRTENYDIVKVFLDYDCNEQKIILNRIINNNILENSISVNNFNLAKKILDNDYFSNFLIHNIENIIINECKKGNVKKLKLFIQIINSHILNKINFEKILFKVGRIFKNCYNEPVLLLLIETILNTTLDHFNNINITLIKHFKFEVINFIINILIEIDNFELFKLLLENKELKSNINVNVKDINEVYPLIFTIQNGNNRNSLKFFKYLLDYGANFNIRNHNNTSLLSLAITNHNYEIVKHLLKSNDNIYNIDENKLNTNQMLKLIYLNDINSFKSLIYNNNMNKNNLLNFDGKESFQCEFTPLILSYILNHHVIFNFLINYTDINEFDSHGYNILYYAMLKEDISTINYLINKNINIDFKHCKHFLHPSILDISIYLGNKDIFDILLNNTKYLSLDIPNEIGETPLITAIKRLNTHNNNNNNNNDNNNFEMEFLKEVISELIKKSVNINYATSFKYPPLVYAIQKQSLEIIKLLIDSGADVNFIDYTGDTPLIHAVKVDNLPIIKFLIENNASINYYDEQGYSPLYYSIQNNSLLVTKYLIENGASININNKNEHSPLEIAIIKNSIPQIQLLIENGINVNYQLEYPTGKSESILIASINKAKKYNEKNNLKEIIEFLSKNYLKIFNGEKIQEFIKYNYFDLLKIIINNHLDINIKDKKGNTPLANAIILKNRRIINYLINQGAGIHFSNNNDKTILDLSYENSSDYEGKIIYLKLKRLIE